MNNYITKNDSAVRVFRVVNGFRIIMCVYPDIIPFYAVTPNCSDRTFYFRDYQKAWEFCTRYENNHKDAFWFRRWSTVHSLAFCKKMNSVHNVLNY